jgi:formate/nitrite transporter FocA (FNT family)
MSQAWADGRISFRDVLRNWTIVCEENFAGAAGPAADTVTLAGMGINLAVVIAGNLAGGSVLVGWTYHLICRRGSSMP